MVDVRANRRSRKWTRRELAGRVAWALAQPLFAWSPRPLWGWRRWLLRRFGAKIGRDVQLYPTVRIEIPWNLRIGDETAVGDGAILYALAPMSIGARTTISQRAHLCGGTHDWRRADMPLLKSPVVIGNDVWICAEAFIGPGVTVGDRAIVGARAVAMRDVGGSLVVAGNPATPRRERKAAHISRSAEQNRTDDEDP